MSYFTKDIFDKLKIRNSESYLKHYINTDNLLIDILNEIFTTIEDSTKKNKFKKLMKQDYFVYE